ncbi:MAG: trypco2 family protein [Tabrizicola sp.]
MARDPHSSKVTISELISEVKDQLFVDADSKQKNLDPKFFVSRVEIEMGVEVVRSTEAEGGIDLYVTKFGGRGSVDNTTTQVVRVTFDTAVSPDVRNFLKWDASKDQEQVARQVEAHAMRRCR